MSTWISDGRPSGQRRVWAVLAVLIPLAGCLEMPGAGPDAVRAVAVQRGDVVITGPRGYCVDPASVRRGQGTGFALLASCESLTGQAAVRVEPAVMTVSVLAARNGQRPPDIPAMARALAPATLRAAEEHDGLSLVQVMQGGEDMLPGGDPVHWRGGMMINGNLLALAVYGVEGGGVAGARGRALLLALADTIRAASPAQTVTRNVLQTEPVERQTLDGLFPLSN